MFGSNDDKKTPAAAGEKKGLFGWLRKKPQETAVEQPQVQAEPIPDPIVEAEPVAEAPAPVVLPMAEPVLQPVVEAEPEPEPEHKPWPELPVAEEPVALVEDVQAEHLAPPIPAVVEPVEVVVEAPPAVEVPAPVAVVVAAPVQVVEAIEVVEPEPLAPSAETTKTGFFARLKQGLSKTSASIGEGMASLFLGKKVIDDELLEDIETRLLTADVGVEATAVIIQSLTQKVARKQLTDADALYKSLQAELAAMLKPVEAPLVITPNKPFVILVVGVNGAGKTTTIGKLAKKLQLEGKKVMLAAGDTFRAAAVEQLQVWGERNKIPVIAQHTGADSASVIFDAVQAAKARNIDVLIADTAGRLHTKDNLMEELKKVRRVIGKLDADAPHEVLLVLDAGTGQNAISQAKQFNQTVQLTGLALTKLDGTAKGGVIFALAKQFGLPIRYIGVGEGIDDLRTFEAEPFVEALFAERERS
ncbi:signal recognition particle-docking protein FtsY [Pseudomonas fluorescens]|uniref:signal recognition particle-docking protein FtsY n=1 Tax=Pseudomonas fluorescens TaxID=294 RepID=UPI00177D7958|nr:signal recognition particle-docking protein FtsY [Pseudomonas fluorescens]MBD8191290.1 signal recognition particle-docking protein FtsY [Pseudomonas fluorescens]MBD8225725.1 signal recognition particle-docking protein FtsY [Pseudomonas fluorescens]MBD8237646.1 signal recognition particle-docking protein FtsY [Pseudomonas fluorescens]MBD8783039.1 signal recognition particle-docking protein FtsY [Pseudomonas fluorescens]MBD8816461.1 signal recognition particle-docking protein FtsY [Pseudomona